MPTPRPHWRIFWPTAADCSEHASCLSQPMVLAGGGRARGAIVPALAAAARAERDPVRRCALLAGAHQENAKPVVSARCVVAGREGAGGAPDRSRLRMALLEGNPHDTNRSKRGLYPG